MIITASSARLARARLEAGLGAYGTATAEITEKTQPIPVLRRLDGS
ncbi:MAG: hypothetical protein ACRD2O_06105 [Terriglobia bacterium]